jgi:tetratricopeptide (TPR) repeat protein
MADSPKDLIATGSEARKQNRLEFAEQQFAAAVASARQIGDPALLSEALTGLGQIERDLRNLDTARAHYEEAVSILRALDDPLRLAHTVRHVGDILRNQGLWKLAAPHYGEALAIYREHPSTPPLDLANTLRGYALLEQQLGNAAQATAFWQEARSLYASVDVQAGVAEAERRIALLTQK